MAASSDLPTIELDAANLYRDEVITDRRVGTLRTLTPVTASGEVDESRSVVFEGQASLMTPGGALPLNFEIEADSTVEALEKYSAAADAALKDMMEQMEELRRQQQREQSGLIVPGQGGPGGPGGGGMGGSAGAGGSGLIGF